MSGTLVGFLFSWALNFAAVLYLRRRWEKRDYMRGYEDSQAGIRQRYRDYHEATYGRE